MCINIHIFIKKGLNIHMVNIYCVFIMTHKEINMKELKIETNVRLNATAFEKMEQLRKLGFSPAAIMRKAIEQALDETLQKARKAGL